MGKIFLSHAVADRDFAELAVEFLMDAIGVPSASIFCSSLPGFGVPLTYDFNDDMKPSADGSAPREIAVGDAGAVAQG